MAIYIFIFNSTVDENGFPTKEEKLTRIQLGQINETFNNFVIGNGTNVNAVGNDSLEHRTNVFYNDSKRIICNASQDQVIGNDIDDKISKTVDNAVVTAKNRMQNTILTAMNEIVIPLLEMAVRKIQRLSGHRPKSVVQKPVQRDFTGYTENNPLMWASNRLDLNIDQKRISTKTESMRLVTLKTSRMVTFRQQT